MLNDFFQREWDIFHYLYEMKKYDFGQKTQTCLCQISIHFKERSFTWKVNATSCTKGACLSCTKTDIIPPPARPTLKNVGFCISVNAPLVSGQGPLLMQGYGIFITFWVHIYMLPLDVVHGKQFVEPPPPCRLPSPNPSHSGHSCQTLGRLWHKCQGAGHLPPTTNCKV